MNGATITIPDEMKRKLEDYARRQQEPQELSMVVQTALREFLERHDERDLSEYRSLQITPAKVGSGRSDISVNHDAYIADDTYKDTFSKP